MGDSLPPLVYTPGEPAGIGPDLILELAGRGLPVPLIALADSEMLAARANALGKPIQLHALEPGSAPPAPRPGHLYVQPVPLAAACQPGRTHEANAHSLLHALDLAVEGCLRGRFRAMVTGPLNKAVINDAGIPFSGHTEYIAGRCGGSRDPVMMLTGGGLRVALATTHLPLSQVSAAITQPRLERVIRTLDRDLKQRFRLCEPTIMVLGLNPHCGEGGHLGREELDVMEPVLERLRREGLCLLGPIPADTGFQPDRLDHCDAVLAMYHDQGLPVLKHASFGHAVNITLGLPVIRTSVDHGTALGLAATGRADAGSLSEALALADSLSRPLSA